MTNLFNQEIKEKKMIASSSRHKTNGRRSKSHMFPIDFMSNKQRKEYIKGGNIVVSNLYDEILTLEKYQKLSDEQKKVAMEHWRKIYNTAAIKKTFNWNDYYIYKEFERIGISVQKRAPKRAIKKEAIINKPISEKPVSINALPNTGSGASFFLDDECDSGEIVNRIMKYAAFLEGETSKFRIHLEIEEIRN